MLAALAAAGVILLAVVLDLPFVRGGSGLVMIVAVGYAYIVLKREVALLSYAVKNREQDEQSEPEDDDTLELEPPSEPAAVFGNARLGTGTRTLPSYRRSVV